MTVWTSGSTFTKRNIWESLSFGSAKTIMTTKAFRTLSTLTSVIRQEEKFGLAAAALV